MGRPATELTELLDGQQEPDRPGALAPLALEEREAPVPGARMSFDRTELDLGEPVPDLIGPEVPAHGDEVGLAGLGFGDLQPSSAPAAGGLAMDVPSGGAPLATGPAAQPSSMPALTPPPAPASDTGAKPPSPEVRAGRLGAVLTNWLSLALLIAVAGALFLTWRGSLVTRLRGALVGRPQAPLAEAVGVRGGLYETASGPAVLVVRGQVTARASLAGPVRVRVSLVDGGRVVASASGLAGAMATPEQVYGAGTAREAAALRKALDQHAAASLAAGSSAPFLVVFPPPLPDPRGLELRVEAEAAPVALTGGS